MYMYDIAMCPLIYKHLTPIEKMNLKIVKGATVGVGD